MMCNDVYSLEKEEARGDMENLVLITQQAQDCSREAELRPLRRLNWRGG